MYPHMYRLKIRNFFCFLCKITLKIENKILTLNDNIFVKNFSRIEIEINLLNKINICLYNIKLYI